MILLSHRRSRLGWRRILGGKSLPMIMWVSVMIFGFVDARALSKHKHVGRNLSTEITRKPPSSAHFHTKSNSKPTLFILLQHSYQMVSYALLRKVVQSPRRKMRLFGCTLWRSTPSTAPKSVEAATKVKRWGVQTSHPLHLPGTAWYLLGMAGLVIGNKPPAMCSPMDKDSSEHPAPEAKESPVLDYDVKTGEDLSIPIPKESHVPAGTLSGDQPDRAGS